MLNFDTRDLQYFVSAANLGSLTACAQSHHLTLAAISKRMQHLEEQLGLALLQRSKKGIELTPAGKIFLEHAKHCLRQIQEIEYIPKKIQQEAYGQIKLIANTTIVQGILPDIIGPFLQNYPDIQINIEEKSSTDIPLNLINDHADLGIFVPSFTSHLDLQIMPFFTDYLMMVVPSNSELCINRDISFRQVINYPLVMLPKTSPITQFLINQSHTLGNNLNIRIETSSFDGIFKFIRQGSGIAVAPLSVCQDNLKRYGLVAIPIIENWSKRQFAIATKPASLKNYPTKIFIDHLLNFSFI